MNFELTRRIIRAGGRVKGGDGQSLLCTSCKTTKPDDSFSKAKEGVRGRKSVCKDCYKEIWLLRKYGITKERYNEMLNEQNGLCYTCGEVMKVPHVDHDHRSGTVRRLLCSECNHALGNVKDSVATLRKMIQYLEEYNAKVDA